MLQADERGYFDGFGGMFVPEILVPTIQELNANFDQIKADPSFWQEFENILATYHLSQRAEK